jgi:hypothetical protein
MRSQPLRPLIYIILSEDIVNYYMLTEGVITIENYTSNICIKFSSNWHSSFKVEDHIKLMSIDVHSVMEKPERRQKFTRSKGYRSICVRCKWGLAYLTYDFNPMLNFAVFVYNYHAITTTTAINLYNIK